MAGLITFAVIILFVLGPKQRVDGDSQPIMTLMAMGLGVSAILGSFVLAGRSKQRAIQALASGSMKNADDSKVDSIENALAGRYVTGMILNNALLEGTGFFTLIAYYVEGHWMALALVAIILAIMAAKFSTPGRVAEWIAQVQRDAGELQGFATNND